MKPLELHGAVVAVGAPDSPQATFLPIHHLRRAGLDPDTDITVRLFDVLGGKHGDHVGGELDAALALAAGEVDAACLLEVNLHAFEADGTLPAGTIRVVSRTAPFDHCNFTVSASAPPALIDRFVQLLLDIRDDDPEVAPLLELEGLRRWLPASVERYGDLEDAVDEAGFYSVNGAVTASGYRY